MAPREKCEQPTGSPYTVDWYPYRSSRSLLGRARLISPLLLSRVSWTTGTFAAVQALRLATNVVLAWLLSPELFGIMLIINTLRTGIDLLSDVGFYQNIVASKKAECPEFLNTAWTMQAIRGVALFMVCALAAYPLARIYEHPELWPLLTVAGLYFIFTGFNSVTRFLLQKRLNLKTLGLFELGVAVFSAITHVLLSFVNPTIWALVVAGVLSSAFAMVISFFLVPGFDHRLILRRDYALEIMSFGKWIFFATAMYFFATNFDRLYIAKALPLAVVGVYGIARTFAELPAALVDRFGGIVFPLVSTSSKSREELRSSIRTWRSKFLLVVGIGVAGFISVSDILITLLYDDRYFAAASMLPALLLGVWFSSLSTLGAAILMGLRRPEYGAVSNTAKFIWLVSALPLMIHHNGMSGAIAAVVGAEVVAYLTFTWALARERLSFIAQDVVLTVGVLLLVALFRLFLWSAGIIDNLGFAIL